MDSVTCNKPLNHGLVTTNREPSYSFTSSFLPTADAQVGYADYYEESIPTTHQRTENDEPQTPRNLHTSELNRAVLRLFNTSELPTATWQSSLLDNFMTYGRPLMPVVDLQWLESTTGYTPPIILVKAVLLAGARVTNTLTPFSSDEYYSSIKAMMFYGQEQNPIINIVVACILGWYNQASVYSVTVDSSSVWLRFASGIAYQIGLHKDPVGQIHASYRRRLWWTLVVNPYPPTIKKIRADIGA